MEAVVVAIAAETEAGAVDVREAAVAVDVAEAVVDAADAVAVAADAAVMVAAAVVDATNVLLLLPRIFTDQQQEGHDSSRGLFSCCRTEEIPIQAKGGLEWATRREI
jgi:hypothetical protein